MLIRHGLDSLLRLAAVSAVASIALLLAACSSPQAPGPAVDPTGATAVPAPVAVTGVAQPTATATSQISPSRSPSTSPAPSATAAPAATLAPTAPPTATPTVPPATTPTVPPATITPSATRTAAPSATLTKPPPTATSAPPPAPSATPTPASPYAGRVWDERLTKRNVVLIPAQVPPGQGYWRLVQAQWFDVDDPPFTGKHHIFVEMLDMAGKRQTGVRMRMASPDAVDIYGYVTTEAKPGEPYAANFAMFQVAPAYRVEPADGAPADAVAGLGMGNIEHPDLSMMVSYGFTWQWTVVGQAVPTATPIAAGIGPGDALQIPPVGQRLVIGQRIWYAFRYAGDATPILVRMHVEPPGAAWFALWTPDDLQRWTHGEPEQPTGHGTADPLYNGDLTWSGAFNGVGVYYVVVDQTGPYAGSFSLSVSGAGVSPAGR